MEINEKRCWIRKVGNDYIINLIAIFTHLTIYDSSDIYHIYVDYALFMGIHRDLTFLLSGSGFEARRGTHRVRKLPPRPHSPSILDGFSRSGLGV